MATSYTTYGCPACGEQHMAGAPGQMCPQLREALLRVNGYVPVTEERVREIAADVFRSGAIEALVQTRNLALEQAAHIAHSWNPTHVQKAAQEIRSLKSQPAGAPRVYTQGDVDALIDAREAMEEERDTLRKKYDEMRQLAQARELTKDETSILLLGGYTFLKTEDLETLRTKLSAAEAALDFIANAFQCGQHVGIRDALKRTGRCLGGDGRAAS